MNVKKVNIIKGESDRQIKAYKLRENESGIKYTLELYHYYPDAEIHRGPYCVKWIPVKAKDKNKALKAMEDQRAIEVKELNRKYSIE